MKETTKKRSAATPSKLPNGTRHDRNQTTGTYTTAAQAPEGFRGTDYTVNQLNRDHTWNTARYTLRQLVLAAAITAVITGLLQAIVWMACKLAEV